jgi:hypothetical protein
VTGKRVVAGLVMTTWQASDLLTVHGSRIGGTAHCASRPKATSDKTCIVWGIGKHSAVYPTTQPTSIKVKLFACMRVLC